MDHIPNHIRSAEAGGRQPTNSTTELKWNAEQERDASQNDSASAPGTRMVCWRVRRGPFGGVLPPLNRHSDGKVVRVLRYIETDALQPSGRHGVPKRSAVQVRRLLVRRQYLAAMVTVHTGDGGAGQNTSRKRRAQLSCPRKRHRKFSRDGETERRALPPPLFFVSPSLAHGVDPVGTATHDL